MLKELRRTLKNFISKEENKKIGFWGGPETVRPIDENWKIDNEEDYLLFVSYIEDVKSNLLENYTKSVESRVSIEQWQPHYYLGWEMSSYRGISCCRVCGCPNGNKELKGNGFTVPFGYLHYVTEHGLIPDKNLLSFIKK